jgi:ATP-dependent Clp protease protease subunit
MPRDLRNLLRLNARKGEFKAEANTIWIYDVIVGDEMEAEFFGGVAPKPFIDALAGMSGPVKIRIDSPGGDVFGANTMAQAMREYKGEITCHVDGVAASAASVLAITGDKTVMSPGSLMMIHNSWTVAVGDRNGFLDTAALLEKIDGMLAANYARKTGGKAEDFAAMMDAETWFTPEEAVAAKLADAVAEHRPKGKASALWDLSAYAKAPMAADPVVTRTTCVKETTETTVETETVEVLSGDPSTTPADTNIQEIEARQRKLAVALLKAA